MWVLPFGANAWSTSRWTELENPAFAPSNIVRAAFSANGVNRAFVLTDDHYHVLDLDSFSWIESGDRNTLFPELAGDTILFAYSYNTDELMGEPPGLTENVAVFTSESWWFYQTFDPIDMAVADVQEEPCCENNSNWQTPESPESADVRAFWFDIVGDNLWVDPEVFNCSLNNPLSARGAAFTDNSAHLQDIGQCFDFLYAADWTDYPPLGLPGAPSSGQLLGGAFFIDNTIYFVGESLG